MSCEDGSCTSASRKRTRLESFNPVDLGLPPDFVLTDYTRLKGCSCKLPQPKLLALLHAISTDPGKTRDVGMDCSIVPVRRSNRVGGEAEAPSLSLVSTTDFFFPSVEDPFLQGQIGCANVLSDLYSMGITECDTILMLLAASTDMNEEERFQSTLAMMKGFAERAALAGVAVTGGQTVLNPWPLIGGVAMRVVEEREMIRPTGIVPGDVLLLTKPLGHQLAVNLKQWLRRPSLLYKTAIEGKMTTEEINELYGCAAENMRRLNLNGAKLMHTYRAHAATDVTGFGLLGHARNLGAAQTESIHLEIHTLPILRGAVKGSRLMQDKYKLLQGFSAETSGGLLVALATEEDAKAFANDLLRMEGSESWIVGRARTRTAEDVEYASLAANCSIVEC